MQSTKVDVDMHLMKTSDTFRDRFGLTIYSEGYNRDSLLMYLVNRLKFNAQFDCNLADIMIEIYRNLFVGGQDDEVSIRGQPGWYVIHACKEPYHRDALGYTGRAASKDHPEYLIARRPGRLILNLVDVADVNYISPEIIDPALDTIHQHIASNKVLVHCNQGMSRSPTIAFLYLLKFTDVLPQQDLDSDLQEFQKLYPSYAPAKGMADYAELNWKKYTSGA